MGGQWVKLFIIYPQPSPFSFIVLETGFNQILEVYPAWLYV